MSFSICRGTLGSLAFALPAGYCFAGLGGIALLGCFEVRGLCDEVVLLTPQLEYLLLERFDFGFSFRHGSFPRNIADHAIKRAAGGGVELLRHASGEISLASS